MDKLFKTLMITALVLGSACASQAQDEDSKIRIKITKDVNGETKTFEGEYNSEEEMRNDPAYREFAGDQENLAFFFDMDRHHDKMIELHQAPMGAQAFAFGFSDDEDFEKNFRRNFRFHHAEPGSGPRAFWFGDDEKGAFDFKSWDSEEFEAELAEQMKELEEKLEGLDKDLQEEILESMKAIESIHSEKGFPRRIKRSTMSIEDAGGDFGKRGKVDAKNELDESAVNFMVMRNQLTIRFRAPEERELSVKISNESGKDIYNRYFESFGGTFSDSIDFSKYSDGKYLLEIEHDKKRLTKKIVIE